MSDASHKRFGRGNLLFIFGFFLVLSAIGALLIARVAENNRKTEVLNNAKALAGGLQDFKNEYGAYPCQSTREKLEESGITNLPPGTNANAYLAQLIVTGLIDSETYFHGEKIDGVRKGDDIFNSPESMLSDGENGFAYIMAPDEKPLTDTTEKTPLVMAPILTGGSPPTFDLDTYSGYFVYGAADGSAMTGKISPRGIAMTRENTPLFQTGRDSLFGDETPVLKMPQKSASQAPLIFFTKGWWAILVIGLIPIMMKVFTLTKPSPEPANS